MSLLHNVLERCALEPSLQHVCDPAAQRGARRCGVLRVRRPQAGHGQAARVHQPRHARLCLHHGHDQVLEQEGVPVPRRDRQRRPAAAGPDLGQGLIEFELKRKRKRKRKRFI